MEVRHVAEMFLYTLSFVRLNNILDPRTAFTFNVVMMTLFCVNMNLPEYVTRGLFRTFNSE